MCENFEAFRSSEKLEKITFMILKEVVQSRAPKINSNIALNIKLFFPNNIMSKICVKNVLDMLSLLPVCKRFGDLLGDWEIDCVSLGDS